MLETWITFGIIVVLLALAVAKLVRDKKKGAKCIGCPMAGQCQTKNKTNCSD